MDIGELVAIGRDLTYFESVKKTRTHSCLPRVKVRALELYYVGPSTQNPIPLLFIFRISGRIRYLIKWVVTGWRLVLIHHPYAVCPGARHLHFPYLSTETSLYELFEGLPGITIKFCTFFVKGVHFVPNCFVEKLLYPHFLATPLKILSVEYDHLSAMKLIRMLRDSSSLPSGGNCRKSRKCSTSGSLFKTAGCSIQMVQY